MRVDLIIRYSKQARPAPGTLPIFLTIRPACGLPGDFEYPTDSRSLLRMLGQQTDLPDAVLRRFEENMHTILNARLLGVELSERVLTQIGYFVD
jgi:hypothetical protein